MAHDLGLTANLLTDLFPQPQTPEEWEPYRLSVEQIKHFKENGFIHGIPLLTETQIEALREQLAQMVDPDHDGREFFYEYHSNESGDAETVLFHALGAWRVRPAFHDILWNPAFLMAAYQLLGKGFHLFHDQLFSKPANHGSVVAWHQDYSYWTWTTPMAHLTCWMGLDNVDTENGCMYYVPGSHKWGLVDKLDLAGDMDAVRGLLTPEQIADFERKTPIEMKAGEASFHHPLLMHGSYENRSGRQRRATLINVFADGVISNREDDSPDSPGTDNYPKVPKGQPMDGTYYPLLFNPEKHLKNHIDSTPSIDST